MAELTDQGIAHSNVEVLRTRSAALLVALPYFAVYALAWRIEAIFGNQFFDRSLLLLLTYGIPLVSVLLIIRLVGVPLQSLGLVQVLPRRRTAEVMALLLLIFLAFKSSVVLHAFLVVLGPESWQEGLIDFRGTVPSLNALFYRCLFAPFMEEFFFRALPAFVLGVFAGGAVVRTSYILISSALFATFHVAYGVAAWLITFYVGIIAALIYLRVRNIWYLVAAHATSNIIDAFWVSHR